MINQRVLLYLIQWRWDRAIALLLLLGIAQPLTFAQSTPDSKPDSSINQSSTRTVTLSLSEVIQIVVQSNRELKNAGLNRSVQRQELNEAESRFNPRFTPTASISITRNQSASFTPQVTTTEVPTSNSTTTLPVFRSGGIGRTVGLSDRTNFTSNAQMQAQLLTRIGTQITLTGDPLSSLPIGFTITQPLLRGFGRTVNEAPVQVARLTNTRGALTLRQTLIDKITDTIVAYRSLYQRQEEVRIQETSLASRRYQLEVTTALVKAGRRARADLVDIEQSLAQAEQELIAARNQRSLANSALLRLIDTPETFLIVISPETIETLIQAAIARTQALDAATLLDTAYRNRPDYLQASLDIETEQLNLIGAQDDKRWRLDLRSDSILGTRSQTVGSLVLSREFGNQTLETAVQRRQVGIQKNTNRFNQLTAIIKTELEDQLQTINAVQKQIIAAQQTTQLAERQLTIAQERFKRSKTINIFEVTQKQDTLTNARNAELNTRLELLVTVAQLDRILGTTLETWKDSIPFQPDTLVK